MSVIERERTEVVAPQVTEADLLLHAADLLEEFGWCQGHIGSKELGYFCAVGALIAAGNDLGVTFLDFVRPVIESFGRPERDVDQWPLATWNDEPDRTKSEVVTKLRERAA